MAEKNTPMYGHIKDYQNGMRKLLERGDHSDVTLSCSDGKIFKAHRAILCAHSEFFSKAFQSDKFIEGNTGQVNLEVGDSAIIAKLLDYLYMFEYDDADLVKTVVSSLWFNAKLYAVADFYMVPSLKKVTQTKFEQSMTKLCSQFKSTHELDELPAIMEFIYENTVDEGGSGLRETVVKIIVVHSTKLFDRDEGFKGLEDIMEKLGAFGRDFSFALLKKWQGFRKVQCQQCRHIWADPRPKIPDGYCPGCKGLKHHWENYQVE